MRTYSLNAAGQRSITMTRAASGVSCYQPGLETEACDYWQATLENAAPGQPLVPVHRQGWGEDRLLRRRHRRPSTVVSGKPSSDPVDNSWALMVHDPAFTAPSWAKGAVIYQIFPDRFRDGRSDNDPKDGDVRYDDPVEELPWATLPEGYCRNYSGATVTSCPGASATRPRPPPTTLSSPGAVTTRAGT